LKFVIVFWDVLPCKIIVDRRFRGTCCLHHTLHPTRQFWTSYSSPWELEISNNIHSPYPPGARPCKGRGSRQTVGYNGRSEKHKTSTASATRRVSGKKHSNYHYHSQR
jgi:hypothetical protein